VALLAATAFAASGANLVCAEAGFKGVLAAEASETEDRWGAFVGLQGVLAATGRTAELIALVDSVIAAGTLYGTTAYIVDAIAGAPVEQQALGAMATGQQYFGEQYERTRNPELLWLYGVWHASRGEPDVVAAIVEHLERRADEPGGGESARLYAAAMRGHLALVRGRREEAITAFENLDVSAHRDTIAWQFGRALPVERLRLSQLYLEAGEPNKAIASASAFDHQGPIVFLPFVPISLALRYRAAEALDRRDLMEKFGRRLAVLGRSELIDVSAAGSPTGGG
jgi:hypothetical protein